MRENKVGRFALNSAVDELHLTLSTAILGCNPARVLSLDDQRRVSEHLNIISPDDLLLLLNQGYCLSSSLPEKLGVVKAAAFKYLCTIFPDWKSSLPTVAQGQRRVHVIAPKLLEKLRIYRDLADARQQLSIWRSQKTRGAFSLNSNLELEAVLSQNSILPFVVGGMYRNLLAVAYGRKKLALPVMTPEQEKLLVKNCAFGVWASLIITHSDIIQVKDEEVLWLEEINLMGSVAYTFIILQLQDVIKSLITQRTGVEYADYPQKHELLFLVSMRYIVKRAQSLVLSSTSLSEMLDLLKVSLKELLVPAQPDAMSDR